MFANGPCRPSFFVMLPNTLGKSAPLCFYISFNILVKAEGANVGLWHLEDLSPFI